MPKQGHCWCSSYWLSTLYRTWRRIWRPTAIEIVFHALELANILKYSIATSSRNCANVHLLFLSKPFLRKVFDFDVGVLLNEVLFPHRTARTLPARKKVSDVYLP